MVICGPVFTESGHVSTQIGYVSRESGYVSLSQRKKVVMCLQKWLYVYVKWVRV